MKHKKNIILSNFFLALNQKRKFKNFIKQMPLIFRKRHLLLRCLSLKKGYKQIKDIRLLKKRFPYSIRKSLLFLNVNLFSKLLNPNLAKVMRYNKLLKLGDSLGIFLKKKTLKNYESNNFFSFLKFFYKRSFFNNNSNLLLLKSFNKIFSVLNLQYKDFFFSSFVKFY